MLPSSPAPANDERPPTLGRPAVAAGFSLVEVLVVVLMIGVLAAIALPAFLGQSAKARDADAQANARNAVSLVEGCRATGRSYAACATDDTLAMLPRAGASAVSVEDTSEDGFRIVARSRSGAVFSVTRGDRGRSRSCESPAGVDGACRGGSW